MPTKRRTAPGFAAVWRKGVCAGSIDSRSGKPNVTPQPRRNVRRGICFLVMNIYLASGILSHKEAHNSQKFCDSRAFLWLLPFLVRSILFDSHPHLEWSTLDDTQNDRRKPVVIFRRIPDDRADHRHIVILDAPAQTVGHQL